MCRSRVMWGTRSRSKRRRATKAERDAPALPPPPPANTAVPTVTGVAQQGQTLTEHHGSWSNEPTGFKYQWLQCDSAGKNCVAIAGAANQTYVLLAGDVGHTIAVEETASNEGGASAPATSSPTGVVQAAGLATFGTTT